MIAEKYAKLRELYPDDIERIEREEAAVKRILETKELAAQPAMKQLVALCRQQIVMARKTLATDRTLDTEARATLWNLIDSRQWVLTMLAQDFDSQLAQIDSELDAELAR